MKKCDRLINNWSTVSVDCEFVSAQTNLRIHQSSLESCGEQPYWWATLRPFPISHRAWTLRLRLPAERLSRCCGLTTDSWTVVAKIAVRNNDHRRGWAVQQSNRSRVPSQGLTRGSPNQSSTLFLVAFIHTP